MKHTIVLGILLSMAAALPANTEETPATQQAPGATSEEALMQELEAAAAADETDRTLAKGSDARYREEVREEDPFSEWSYGAKEVTGNEANPAISLILDTAFAFFSEDERYRQGGHAPAVTGPNIQGAELAVSASVDPFFRVDLAFGLYHLHVEEVYATTMALPWNLQVRGGQFKSDIGRHNPTHLHQWHFVTHPLANGFLFGAEGLSLPGGELSVLLPLPWYVEVIAALQVGDSGSFRTDFSTNPSFADFIYPLRVVQFFDLTDDWGCQVGVSSVLGTSQSSPVTGNRTYTYGADLLLRWRPIGQGRTGYRSISWITEGWFREMELAGDLWRDLGGYSDLIVTLHKQWAVALRGELWRRLAGGMENEAVNRARFGLNSARGNVSVSFSPSHFSRIRLQYGYERIETFEDNQSVLLQLEVSAGAHGAHQY
jgi:hypothetical protein